MNTAFLLFELMIKLFSECYVAIDSAATKVKNHKTLLNCKFFYLPIINFPIM